MDKPAAAQTVTEQTFGQWFEQWRMQHPHIIGPRDSEVWHARDAAFAALQQENESIRRVLGELIAAARDYRDDPYRDAASESGEVSDSLWRLNNTMTKAIKVMEGGK